MLEVTHKVIVGCSTLPFKAFLLLLSSWDLMPKLRGLPYWSSNMPSLPRLLALVHPVALASHLSPALPPTSHPSFQMQPKSSDFTHVVYAEIAILILSHIGHLPVLSYTHIVNVNFSMTNMCLAFCISEIITGLGT